ncbi:hypothetical protein MPSEU_000091100 [Mayamaea pseudoterrestris]|nr:hypothetical protein MPSEU_000091100 [Mayamaea pseudoterrestris]
MVAIKAPSLKKAETRQFYRVIIGCGAILFALLYLLYAFHIERLYVRTADAAILEIERKMKDSAQGNGLPISDSRRIQEETYQALAYVQSFKSLDRSLKFFHIPKTAGTATENAAGAHHIPWGSCLFRHTPKRDVCRYPENTMDWPTHVGYWHLPRFLFPACNIDPYQNAETFAVVREPYDRMVSEFYYICTLKVFDWRPDQCKRQKLHEEKYMNKWLQRKLEPKAAHGGDDELFEQQLQQKKTVHPALQYLSDNGHFTPQYEFIVGPNQVRYVDFVLTLENVADTFTELMSAFGLDKLTLKKMNALGAASRDEAQLTTKHLSAKTMELMHQRFENDFMFGYSKRTIETDKKEGALKEVVEDEDDKAEITEDEDDEAEVNEMVEDASEDDKEAADNSSEDKENDNDEGEGDDQAVTDDGSEKRGLRKKSDDDGST